MHTLESKGWVVNEKSMIREPFGFGLTKLIGVSGEENPTFGRSPRPGKWKNIQALTDEDVKGLKE